MGKSASNIAPIVPSSPEWYLDIKGHRSGPFSAEQIVGLLRDGEIPADQSVTSQRLHGHSIPASQLMALLANGSAQFDPPPRPDAVSHENLDEPKLTAPVADSTRDLFDTLQAVKEKRSHAAAADDRGSLIPHARRLPPQLGLFASVITVIGIAIWGTTKLLSVPTAEIAAKPSAAPAAVAEVRKPAIAAVAAPARSMSRAVASAPTAARPTPSSVPVRRFSLPDRPQAIVPPPRAVSTPQAREDWRRGDYPRREETRSDDTDDRRRAQDEREDQERAEANGEFVDRSQGDKDPFASAARSGDPRHADDDSQGGRNTASSNDEEPAAD